MTCRSLLALVSNSVLHGRANDCDLWLAARICGHDDDDSNAYKDANLKPTVDLVDLLSCTLQSPVWAVEHASMK